MNSLKCQVSNPVAPEESFFSVGDRIQLRCQPLEETILPEGEWRIAPGWANPYQFLARKIQLLGPQILEIQGTSLVVGQQSVTGLQFQVRSAEEVETTFSVEPFSLDIRSVLNPTQPEKEPYGPMIIANPQLDSTYIYGGIGGLVLLLSVLGLLAIRAWYRRHLWKKFSQQLEPGQPLVEQYMNQVKSVHRSPIYYAPQSYSAEASEIQQLIQVIQQAWLLFLGASYRQPITLWSARAQRRWFRKLRHSVKPSEQEIYRLYHELQNMQLDAVSLKYIYDQCLRWVLSQKKQGPEL